jgi:photosystem II stability/assembly factor-like uncharacterized protein
MNGSTVAATMSSVAVSSSGRFVAIGYNSSGSYATSTNGSTWTTPELMNNSVASATMLGVAVNSAGLFAAVGFGGPSVSSYARWP